MKKNKIHIVWAIIAVATLVGGIFIGKAMAPARGAGSFAGFGSSTAHGPFTGRGGAASGGIAIGQVTAIDSTSITLQLPNGNSENVFYASGTPVIVPQPASISSITPGTNVIVTGTQNSDGSLTAQSIQVRDAAGSGPKGFTSATGNTKQ